MYKYTLLNVVFTCIAGFVIIGLKRNLRPRIDGWILALVLLLTAVFDSVIVSLGIVAYHPEHLLGINLGKAPVEDFAYAIVAALLMPLLWRTLRSRHDS